MNFGLRLSRLSKVRNVSLAALARNSNLSRSTINRVINNEVSPNVVQMNQISSALGISTIDMLNVNIAPETFSLTGYAIIDKLILNAGRLRAMPQGPEMDALYKETHTPDAICYSRWYNALIDRRIDNATKPPCEIRLRNGYECQLHEHPNVPHLYGIDVKSELYLNSCNVREDHLFCYFPVAAQLTERKRIQVISLFHCQGYAPQYNIDEYNITADIQSMIHGKASPLLKTKLWSQIPTATGYRMSDTSMESYINNT